MDPYASALTLIAMVSIASLIGVICMNWNLYVVLEKLKQIEGPAGPSGPAEAERPAVRNP